MPFSIINDYRKPKKCFKNWIRNRNLTLHFLNTVYSESPHTNLGCHEWSGCNGIGLKQRPDIYTMHCIRSVRAKSDTKIRHTVYRCIRYVRDTKNRHIPLLAYTLSVTSRTQRSDVRVYRCIRSVRHRINF